METALFSEESVGDYYDTVIAVQAERRMFNISAEELCTEPLRDLVDAITSVSCPGGVILAGEGREGYKSASDDGTLRVTTWLEFTGAARLLRLRPRQRYADPPRVSRLEPAGAGEPGRLVIEGVIHSEAELRSHQEGAERRFRAIRDSVVWLNEDLDFHEQALRAWLWTLMQTRRKRLQKDRNLPAAVGSQGD